MAIDQYSRQRSPLYLLTAAAFAAAWIVPTTASAEPQEWDIGEYDRCMGYVDTEINEGVDQATISRHMDSCCTETGGVLGPGNVCQAPPAEPAQLRPGLVPQPGATLQTSAPSTTAPPPARILPTFAPSTG